MDQTVSETPKSDLYIQEYEEDYEDIELSEWDSVGLRPDTPLLQQHREICRYLAHGKKNKWICAKMQVTPAWLSTLKRSPKIQKEVSRIRDKLFSVDLASRFDELSVDAMDVMEELIMSPHVSTKDKESAARWILEKTTGKPAQQIEHKGEVSIGVFLDKLDQQSTRDSLPEASPIDIIPKDSEPEAEAEPDDLSVWIDKNLE